MNNNKKIEVEGCGLFGRLGSPLWVRHGTCGGSRAPERESGPGKESLLPLLGNLDVGL